MDCLRSSSSRQASLRRTVLMNSSEDTPKSDVDILVLPDYTKLDGFGFFGAEAFGVLCVDAWAAACGIVLFWTIKHTVGLRVDKRVEEEGLDIYEHGESCYNG